MIKCGTLSHRLTLSISPPPLCPLCWVMSADFSVHSTLPTLSSSKTLRSWSLWGKTHVSDIITPNTHVYLRSAGQFWEETGSNGCWLNDAFVSSYKRMNLVNKSIHLNWGFTVQVIRGAVHIVRLHRTFVFHGLIWRCKEICGRAVASDLFHP